MKLAWQKKFGRYEAMTAGEQVVWLSHLLFSVSMPARETYGATPDAVGRRSYVDLTNSFTESLATCCSQLTVVRAERRTTLFHVTCGKDRVSGNRGGEPPEALEVKPQTLFRYRGEPQP